MGNKSQLVNSLIGAPLSKAQEALKDVKINDIDEFGYTILMHIIEAGLIDLAEYLISRGADPNKHHGIIKDTSLSIAVKTKQSAIVELLLRSGANPDLKYHPGGETALMYAVHIGASDIARILIAGSADIDKADALERTALHHAIMTKHPEIATMLIQHGADPNTSKCNAAHEAVINGDHNTIQALIEAGRSKNNLLYYVGLQDNDGFTPLMKAIKTKDMVIARLLIDSLMHLNAQSQTGKTALTLAVETGDYDLVKLLISKGAVIEGPVQSILHDYATPLIVAALCGYSHIAELLIEHGANVDFHMTRSQVATTSNYEFVNYVSCTPLDVAIMAGHKDVALSLIACGASFSYLGASTAIHNEDKELARTIIELGKHNYKQGNFSHYSCRLIIEAVGKGMSDILKLLIRHNAAIVERDNHGHIVLSALDYIQDQNLRDYVLIYAEDTPREEKLSAIANQAEKLVDSIVTQINNIVANMANYTFEQFQTAIYQTLNEVAKTPLEDWLIDVNKVVMDANLLLLYNHFDDYQNRYADGNKYKAAVKIAQKILYFYKYALMNSGQVKNVQNPDLINKAELLTETMLKDM